jgi:23S rRNA (guanosine2251-2'-O)-methyltransferase
MHVYGIHPVEELIAFRPDDVQRIYCAAPDSDRFHFVRTFANANDIHLERRNDSSLSGMTDGGNHQGIVVETKPYTYTEFGQILDNTADARRASLGILDQVQDPQNLGAVLRSAAAMGLDGVVIPKDRAAGVTGAVIRASAGQAYRMDVAKVTNISRTLRKLADNGWWSVALLKETEQRLHDIDLDMKTAVVLGSESEGIRRLVRETSDWRATIPMAEGVESLNIASAASIAFYEVRRQWE